MKKELLKLIARVIYESSYVQSLSVNTTPIFIAQTGIVISSIYCLLAKVSGSESRMLGDGNDEFKEYGLIKDLVSALFSEARFTGESMGKPSPTFTDFELSFASLPNYNTPVTNKMKMLYETSESPFSNE